jgi:hypothetical protein
MIKTINAFVVATQDPWDKKPVFMPLGFDPQKMGMDHYVVVAQTSFEVHIADDFDMRPHQVAALEKKKRDAQAAFAAKVKEIDDQINSLLAIGTAKVVDDGTAN